VDISQQMYVDRKPSHTYLASGRMTCLAV